MEEINNTDVSKSGSHTGISITEGEEKAGGNTDPADVWA